MSGTDIGSILLFLFAFAIYFLPSIIGWNKRNSTAIVVLNLLLGWTIIGWIVALVWACTNDAPVPYQSIIMNADKVANKPSIIDELQKLDLLKTSGAITDSEYQTLKGKIIA
jgi:hypothetical protein